MQRLKIPIDTSWTDVLDLLHETISCDTVTIKPDLTYRLSSSQLKSASVSLHTTDDWEGCIEDVTMTAQTPKNKGPPTIIIMLPEIVSDIFANLWSTHLMSCKVYYISEGSKGSGNQNLQAEREDQGQV